MPKVLNRHIDEIPPEAVYIGRPSKWGNPFLLGKDGSRDIVLYKYKDWLETRPDIVKMAKEELKGKDLVCYCSPKSCHGDILLEIANS